MYRYDVDEKARLVNATFEGEVTDSDLFEYLSHMLTHTRYSSGWGSLIELSDATAIHLTTAGVQRMRALPLYMEVLLGARAAIVAPEGSVALEMARLYEKMAGGKSYQIAVFTNRDEAMRWLTDRG